MAQPKLALLTESPAIEIATLRAKHRMALARRHRHTFFTLSPQQQTHHLWPITTRLHLRLLLKSTGIVSLPCELLCLLLMTEHQATIITAREYLFEALTKLIAFQRHHDLVKF